MYVTDIDTKTNRVTLGDNADLFTDTLHASSINYIAFDKPEGSFRCTAKVRYSAFDAPCTVYPTENGLKAVLTSLSAP